MEGNSMNNEQYIQRITAVINTLNGTVLRADQIDAFQRINVCTSELKAIMSELSNPQKEE